MERVKKTKSKPTLESLLFVTPEQKLLRFLVSESTTTFTPRVLSSKLKGVRGLGGIDGLNRILKTLKDIGLVEFKNNNRAVAAHNDHTAIRLLKTFASFCDLEGLQDMVEPMSIKGVLFGSRASGECRSDSDYDLLIVTDQVTEVQEIVTRHPIGKKVELFVYSPEQFAEIEAKDKDFGEKVAQGIVLWGSTW